MATKVIMPQLGESVVEGTVTKWLRREGEPIAELDALLEVNTDKVDSEIPSPAGGTVLKILVPEGQTVQAGTTLAWIGEPGEALPGEESGGDVHAAQTQPLAAGQAGPAAPAPQEAAAPSGQDLGFISPVVARVAREQNVDLAQVTGTGTGGRITKQDVLAYLEQRDAGQPPAPGAAEPAAWETPGEGDLFRPTELQFAAGAPAAPAQPKAPPEMPSPAAQPKPTPPAQSAPSAPPAGAQVRPLSTMRRAIAERMVASKSSIPHVTTVMEADLSRVVAHRAAHKAQFAQDGANLTFTAYFAAATVQALKRHPLVNSAWGEEGILLQPDINLGLAASLGAEGLIVPVIRGADGLSLLGMARAINDVTERARTRRLNPADVQGGTFTITNHGVSGSLFAAPIINMPQCAILGIGAIQKRVIVTAEDAIAVRPMVYLSLTFDHRILDGAAADGFLAAVVSGLEHWA